MLFAENGLSPDVDFTQPDKINSKTDGKLSDNTIIAKTVNKYKNYSDICIECGQRIRWTDPKK